MNRTKWAIFIAMASGTFAATAYAETKQSPFTPSAYEYGNYDYYSQISAPAAQAPPSFVANSVPSAVHQQGLERFASGLPTRRWTAAR